jgi:hypothetical protein
MSSNRRVTFADLVAAKLPSKPDAPTPGIDSVQESTAPVLQEAPVPPTAPVQQPAPVPYTPQPLYGTPAVPQEAPVRGTAPVRQTGGHTRVTHEVSDEVLPTLDVYAQSILQRLLRLSWGWSQETCKVGLPRLASACNISESKARRALRVLIARHLVEIVDQDFSSVNQAERGTTYKILMTPTHSTAPGRQTAPVRGTAPVQRTPIKVKDLKETNKRENELPLDTKSCPDCQGSGFWYPEGTEKGVAKCKHERLTKGEHSKPPIPGS